MPAHSVCRRKKACVRAWSADQQRYPNKTLQEAEKLVREGFVTAKRNSRGLITTIFYPPEFLPSRRNRFQAGTKYSFREVDLPTPVWTLKELPYRAANAQTEYLGSQEEIDVLTRAMFLGVGRSVLAEAA